MKNSSLSTRYVKTINITSQKSVKMYSIVQFENHICLSRTFGGAPGSNVNDSLDGPIWDRSILLLVAAICTFSPR